MRETHKIGLAFPLFFGATFYDNTPREAWEPLPIVDSTTLDWVVFNRLGKRKKPGWNFVFLAKAPVPLRVMASAVGKWPCVLLINEGDYIATDLRYIWCEENLDRYRRLCISDADNQAPNDRYT